MTIISEKGDAREKQNCNSSYWILKMIKVLGSNFVSLESISENNGAGIPHEIKIEGLMGVA